MAFAGHGFIGASLNNLGKDLFKNLKWADGPVVPLVFKSWPYNDAEYGCDATAGQHKILECYFLPSNDCHTFSPDPLLTKIHDEVHGRYLELPQRGAGELCGHTSLLMLLDEGVGQSPWRVECDATHHEGRGGNENQEIIQLFGACGDYESCVVQKMRLSRTPAQVASF